MLNNVTLKYWIGCAVILYLKMLFNSFTQGYLRVKNKHFVNPEDASIFGRIFKTNATDSEVEAPLIDRASRCWRNDLENIPMFLIISIGYVLAGGRAKWGLIYFSVFTGARIFHTICYMMQIQPWRNLSYVLGVVTTITIAVHSIGIAWR